MLKKLIFFVAGLSLIGCGQESDTNNDTATADSTARGESCDTPQEVACIDDMILDLSYQDTVASTDVTNLREGQQWLTTIDATAGGFGNSSSNPWVYIRFTDTGAQKVEISDEDSLESMDWHLAAHRFKLRLNSGTGGPSCVKAAALLEGDYDTLDRVPENLTFYADTFYTSDCSLIEDSYGLETPQVYMSGWWEYPGCVATTGMPFIVQLDDGRRLKLRVESYYVSGQETCNEEGVSGNGSANVTIRWGFFFD